MSRPKIHGYTTLMTPESMNLPYLETLLSWSRICDTITVCYSTFPKLDLEVPDGAICPWEDDGSLDILAEFNREVLNGKLHLIQHEWDPNEPMEDGITKQLARAGAHKLAGDDQEAWLAHFDGDEILNDGDDLKLLELINEDNSQQEKHLRRPFILTGILELFGSENKVRFDFGNWCKIRLTRNIKELEHGCPLRLGAAAVRGRNPRTGKIISIDNRDDGAGFINNLTLTRPDYNMGIWGLNPQILNSRGQIAQANTQQWPALAQMLNQDIQTGVWLFHTSWIDIPRKWKMGWHFDNFWAVLSGKQDTYEEKAKVKGKFTHTRVPDADKLHAEIEREMARPSIQEIQVERPSVFDAVANWRSRTTVQT